MALIVVYVVYFHSRYGEASYLLQYRMMSGDLGRASIPSPDTTCISERSTHFVLWSRKFVPKAHMKI